MARALDSDVPISSLFHGIRLEFQALMTHLYSENFNVLLEFFRDPQSHQTVQNLNQLGTELPTDGAERHGVFFFVFLLLVTS